eukprot:4605627-Amphidinium_carterae.1
MSGKGQVERWGEPEQNFARMFPFQAVANRGFPCAASMKELFCSLLVSQKVLFRTPNSAKSDAVRRIVSVDANGKSVYKEDTLMGLIVHSSYYTYVSFLLVFANTLWVSFELDIAQEDFAHGVPTDGNILPTVALQHASVAETLLLPNASLLL